MTARERVIAALDHRKPDRLPRYEIFFPSFIENARAAGKLPPSVDIHEKYKIDIPAILARQNGPLWRSESREDDGGETYLVRDSWGRRCRYHRDTGHHEILDATLKEKGDIDSIPWDSADDFTLSLQKNRSTLPS